MQRQYEKLIKRRCNDNRNEERVKRKETESERKKKKGRTINEETILCATPARWVFVRRVRTSVGVAKMNFHQLVAGRSLKPTELVVSSDPTAICRPFVRQRAQHRRATAYCGYHGPAVITDRGYYRTSVNLDTQLHRR